MGEKKLSTTVLLQTHYLHPTRQTHSGNYQKTIVSLNTDLKPHLLQIQGYLHFTMTLSEFNTTTSTKYMYKPMITAGHEIPNVEKQIFEYTHVASLLFNLRMRTGEQRCRWESPHDLVNQREKKNPRNQTANDGVKNIWYSRLATQNST